MAINSLQDVRDIVGNSQQSKNPKMSANAQKNASSGINSLEDIRNIVSGNQPDNDMGFMNSSLAQQLSRIPEYAEDAATNLPSEIWNTAKEVPASAYKVVTSPLGAARDLAGGIARGSQKLASAGLEGGEYVTRKGAEAIGRLTGKNLNVPKWNAREFMGLEGENPIDLGSYIETKNPDPLLSMAGQYGLGGAAGASKGLLGFVGVNALNSALQAPPDERIQAGVQGAVNTALPVGLGKAAKFGYNTVRPSNSLRGNLSPEELQANLEAAQGTNTNLGDVIGSPTLKRIYENVLPHVPLSGAFNKMQQTANQVTAQGENLMGKIGEKLPEGDKTEILQTALDKASREATQEKNADYNKVNKIADESGMVVGRSNLQTKAQQILEDIDQSPELKRELPPDLLSDLQQYARNSEGNSLKLSNIFKGKLNDKTNDYYVNGKTYEAGIHRDLKNALGQDIEGAIKDSNNPELKTAYDEAQKNYGLKFKPFEDPDIVKFTRKGGDPDILLSHFLKGGINDRGTLLSKLTSKLPEDLKELPLHMYLSKAIDETGRLNPLKFRTLYKNLGEKQREALVSDPVMRRQIDKYVRTVGLNTDSFTTMFNPKTGQRHLDSAIGSLEGILAYTNPIKAGLAIGGGNVATRLLTSEKLREALVNKMLNQKK